MTVFTFLMLILLSVDHPQVFSSNIYSVLKQTSVNGLFFGSINSVYPIAIPCLYNRRLFYSF